MGNSSFERPELGVQNEMQFADLLCARPLATFGRECNKGWLARVAGGSRINPE